MAAFGHGEDSILAKIMIVDDDRTTVKLLQTLLELDGFVIQVVGRGADVIPQAQSFQPDLLLMDYHLSDTDGVDVIRDLRATEQFATTPIIMTSGLDVEDEALSAGANRFLLKPFEPDDLPSLFNSLITG
jgi:DNA-binding response OmpR family regulator